jgi:MraZ protein
VGKSGEFLYFYAVFQHNIKKLVRFLGNIDAKTDVKGRVFIPASFRKILQTSGNTCLILKKDIFQDCLILYPETVWNDELEKLRERLSIWNEEQQNIFRQFIRDVEMLEIDSNGRVLIPKRYLQMAGIISDIRFMGMFDKIEIWSKDNSEKTKMDADSFKRGIEKYMA